MIIVLKVNVESYDKTLIQIIQQFRFLYYCFSSVK